MQYRSWWRLAAGLISGIVVTIQKEMGTRVSNYIQSEYETYADSWRRLNRLYFTFYFTGST